MTSSDLFGSADFKFESLLSTPLAQRMQHPLNPTEPHWLFKRQDETGRDDYECGWGMPTIFNRNGDPAPGMVTTHDEFAVSWDAKEAKRKVEALLATNSEAEARQLFQLCTQNQWSYDRAKAALARGEWKRQVVSILYRPFDERFTIWNSHVAVHRRERVSAHFLLGENVGISCTRATEIQGPFQHVFCTKLPTQHHTVSLKEVNYLFPLWLYAGQSHKIDLYDDDLIGKIRDRSANLGIGFVSALAEAINLSGADWRAEDHSAPLHAANVFHYIYAILNSPAYRERYAAFLRVDFPRIPIPASRALFDALASLGEQLVQWHLLEHAAALAITATTAPKGTAVPAFFGKDRTLLKVAEKGRALAETEASAAGPVGKLCINATSGFSKVREQIWQHTIGGYQVLHKWLDDRRKAGRSLSDDDIAHWRRVYAALEATQALMRQVDEAIDAHGGWPGAFSQKHPPPDPATVGAEQTRATYRRVNRTQAGQTGLFDGHEDAGAPPRPKARATPARAASGAANQSGLDDGAVMCALREVLRNSDSDLDRNSLIRATAHTLGYKRTGARLSGAIDDAVRRAVRRGIVQNKRGRFSLYLRTIAEFNRTFLRNQLLACLGHGRTEHRKVATKFARWMGFARTGAVIERTVKGLLAYLLRAEALKLRDNEVRRA